MTTRKASRETRDRVRIVYSINGGAKAARYHRLEPVLPADRMALDRYDADHLVELQAVAASYARNDLAGDFSAAVGDAQLLPSSLARIAAGRRPSRASSHRTPNHPHSPRSRRLRRSHANLGVSGGFSLLPSDARGSPGRSGFSPRNQRGDQEGNNPGDQHSGRERRARDLPLLVGQPPAAQNQVSPDNRTRPHRQATR